MSRWTCTKSEKLRTNREFVTILEYTFAFELRNGNEISWGVTEVKSRNKNLNYSLRATSRMNHHLNFAYKHFTLEIWRSASFLNFLLLRCANIVLKFKLQFWKNWWNDPPDQACAMQSWEPRNKIEKRLETRRTKFGHCCERKSKSRLDLIWKI